LRLFLEKCGVFLRIVFRWAGHPILKSFLEKHGDFLRIFKKGKSPDIVIIGLERRGVHSIWGPLFRKNCENKKFRRHL
jgi:hypothetical protein